MGFTIDIPSIPKVSIDGITFEADQDVVLTFTGIELSNDFSTTKKSIILTNGAFSANVHHYVLTGSIGGFILAGDGTMDLNLGDKIINEVSYTSTSADSFCAVEGSVDIAITTHTANLTITGMDDPTEKTFEDFVNTNGPTLGSLVSGLIKSNYGEQI